MTASALNELQRDACTEAYLIAEPHITQAVWAFKRKYGGHYEDLRADADDYFIIAYDRWIPARGPFEKYVRFIVFKQLLERVRTEASRNSRLPRDYETELEGIPRRGNPAEFTLPNWFFKLSANAQMVLDLILDPTPDVILAYVQRGDMRAAIREYLRDLGWTVRQITGSFQEIQETRLTQ